MRPRFRSRGPVNRSARKTIAAAGRSGAPAVDMAAAIIRIGAGYGAETSENVWRPAISSEKSGVSARDEAPGGRLVPVAGTSKPLKAGRLKRSPKHLALDRSGAAPADH